MIARYTYFAPIVALIAACRGGGVAEEARPGERDEGPRPQVSAPAPAPAPTPAARGRTLLFIGTSLTAGFGLDPSQAYPALIQQKIDSAGLDWRVVNAGVSGETSAGARSRIDWLLREPVSLLVLETGANDGLRGLSTDALRDNIQFIVDRARRQTPAPRIVLVGMRALPNLGPAYGRRFEAVYPELARANDLPLIPFLLEGVAGEERLNQPDGVHPTAAGQRILAETVWRYLLPVLTATS